MCSRNIVRNVTVPNPLVVTMKGLPTLCVLTKPYILPVYFKS